VSSVLNRNWPENLALGNYYVDLIAYLSKFRPYNWGIGTVKLINPSL